MFLFEICILLPFNFILSFQLNKFNKFYKGGEFLSDKNIDLSLYNISRRIKLLRTKKNLSQEELGKLIGVTKSTISSYENYCKFPSLDKLVKLAITFNVSTDQLLGIDHKNLEYIDYEKILDNVVSLKDLTDEDKILVKNIIKHLRNKSIDKK